MKKFAILVILAFLIVLIPSGCASEEDKDVPAVKGAKSERLLIVATLFPQYDFARQIAGEKGDVVLLLPPGVESHSFEPAPSDIIRINQSDLFLYTGEYMEVWSRKIIDGMKDSGSDSLVLDLSQNIDLVKTEEIEAEHHHEEGEAEEHDHDHYYDPHIWTDPLNAKVMVSDIRDALCSVDPANAEYYKENADGYLARLDDLDTQFRSVVSNAKRNEVIFGSRFALYYFAKRYGLDYESAFDSCSSETEPSARAVADLIEEIRENRIPVIYYAEMEDPKVARSISAETGAEMLLFHSCHNVTKEELEKGATYLSLMEQNVKNLKEGLE